METKNGERDLQKALNASIGAEMESLQGVSLEESEFFAQEVAPKQPLTKTS